MKRGKVEKRALSVLLAVTLATGTIMVWEPGKAAIVQAADENLIENGDFETIGSWKNQDDTEVSAQGMEDKVTVTEYMENGDFEDTNNNPWADSGAAPAITAGAGYNGTTGLVLTRAENASGNPYANAMVYDLDTTGEVTYTVSLRTKSEGVTWRLYVIENGADNWKAVGDYSQTEWETYRYQFSTTTGKVQLGLQLVGGSGKLYVDDFSVIYESKSIQTTVTEIMENGDFEEDTLKWIGYNNAEPKLESEAGYDNTSGLVLERSADASSNPYATYMINNLDTTGEVTYTVSLRGKSEGVTWRLYVIENGAENWNALGDCSETEWGEYSYQFTTTTGKVQLGLQLVSGSGKLYVDDFSVKYETVVQEQHDIFLTGDFEDGINKFQDSGELPTITDGKGYKETKGLVLTRTADASGNPYAYTTLNDLDTTGKVTYTVNFRTKSDGVTWRMYVTQNDNANWKAVGDYDQTDWESYSYQFTTTTGKAQIGFQLMNGDVGELYVDDFTVSYGTVAYEKTYTEGIGDCNGAETGSVLSMKNDTKVTQPIELSMGSYEYSFKVKCIEPSTDFSFGIQAGDTKAAVTVTSEWNTVTGTLELSESASSFGFYRSGTGEVLIDDVVLVDMTTAQSIHFSAPKFDGETLSFSNDFLTAEKMKELYPDFTNGSLSAKGSVWIDDKKYSVNYSLATDGTISIKNLGKDAFGDTQYIGENCKKIEIKEGTRLRFGNADPLKVANTITIQKTAVGAWYDVDNMGTAAELDLSWVDCEEGTAVFEGKEYSTASETTAGTTSTTAGKILVNGEVRSATITHSETTVTLNIADGFVAEGLNTVVIPEATIWNDSDGNPMYYLKQDNTFYVEKREGSWLAWDSEYDYQKTDVQYVDMGSGKPYLFTQASVDNNGMGGSMVIEGNSALTNEVSKNGYAATSTLGDYHVKKTIGTELYDYNVVLYKRGNAHAVQTEGETEVLDSRDLVAVKKALLSESEQFSKAELKAADCNVDGALDEYDADFLRKALVNEWDIMTAAGTESVLDQGTMPIVGYNGPGADADGSTARLTESVYSLVKEMGFNTVVTPTVDADTTTSYKEQSYPVLDLAQKYGIKVWLNDSVITNQSTTEKVLSERTGQYNAFDSFAGFYIADDSTAGYGAEAIVYANYLRPNGQTTESYALATQDFYETLDAVRTDSMNAKKPFQAFVQTGTDFSDTNSKKTEQTNLTTRQEMYLEANAALAMGAKGIYYFNLMQNEDFAKSTDETVDYYRNGLINVNGEANHGENSDTNYDYFDTAKIINSYVAEIDMVLMNAESKGVMTTDTTVAGYIEEASISSYGAVKSVSGDDAFVGCFDYYGKDTYLVVNKSVTTQQSITLDFGGASRTYATTDMSLNKAVKSGVSVTLNIAAGESVLVILEPFENQKTVLRAISPKNGEIVACASETVTELITDYTPKKSDDGSVAQRKDSYQREAVTLTWSGNADSYTIKLSTNRNMSDVKEYTVSGTSLQLENLLADRNYYWQISDGESTSAVYNFHTQKTVRTLTIDSISNTRDIGGYMTSSGKMVKQGMVYRGARLDSISSTGKATMLEELGIQTDLDLRGDGNLTQSPLGETVNFVYVKAPTYTINDVSYNGAMAEAIRTFAKEENYPIYMHCSIGRDRTGTVSFLINALLGVQKNDLYMDYELSFLSRAATGDLANTNISGLIDKYFTTKLYNYIQTFSKDGTIQSGAEQYMLSIGITQEEIAAIRTLLLE